MRYSLRQLEVFLSVARGESVGRAARELSMSQSAVSGALAELERQFDIQLFDRRGKRLQLSALGRALRPEAEALYDRASQLERAFASEGRAGALRVGATLTIGNYLAVPLMARFMAEHADADVALTVDNTARIVRRVVNFELDVGLVEGEVLDPELEVSAWRQDELSVFCAPGHPFARRRRLSDADLVSARWIVREPGSGTRQAFERAMHGLLSNLRVGLELQHTEAIKRAVEANLGVGCISRIALTDTFADGRLVPCRVSHRDFRRQFYFVLHRHKFRTPAIQAWIDLCKQR